MSNFWSRASPTKHPDTTGEDSNDCTTVTDVTYSSMDYSVAPTVTEHDQLAADILLYNPRKPDGAVNGKLLSHADGDVRKSDLSGSDDLSQKEDEQCGWGPFRPRWCQVFRNAKVVLLILCIVATIQGMVVNGFVSVVISTIEKRFNLSSRQSGFIASGYDIASVLCLIPISYFGGIGHKPRWIAGGILLLSLGSFLFAMPHFIVDKYTYGELISDSQAICVESAATSSNFSSVRENDSSVSQSQIPLDRGVSSLDRYMFILVLAQMLHGAGATPIYTLAVTYLDDSLKTKVAPLYLGIFYTTAIIGPAIGYILGGQLLEIYCDIGAVDMTTVDLTPSDSRWIGAWWIGFLISGSLSFLVAIPLSAFPKSIPVPNQPKKILAPEKFETVVTLPAPIVADDIGSEEDAEVTTTAKPGFRMSYREIPSSLGRLLCNATFMSLNMSGACEGMLLSGFVVFTPKFVESQFHITAAWAAQLIGMVTIPSGGGGTFFGGYLVKRLNLRFTGILRLCLVTTGLTLALTLTFLFRCENIPFVGITHDHNYIEITERSMTAPNLTAACNSACHCDAGHFDPICSDQMKFTYFSPCFAGCTSSSDFDGRKIYSNCSCFSSAVASEGKCSGDCQLLNMFLVIFAFIIFTTFTTSMPALAATLRCVPVMQRSFALGIQWILFRTLGMIPAPILFGALIDYSCTTWKTVGSSSDKGECLMYDNWAMGTYLLILIVLCKVISLSFFAIALFRYRPPEEQCPTPATTVSGISCSVTSEIQPMVDLTSSTASKSEVT